MGEFRISDLKRGKPDATGELVVDIQTKIDGRYAVYYTDTRVKIQFADNQKQGENQRKALSPISDKRSKANSLIDELRQSGDPMLGKHAMARSRELGTALAQCLVGEAANAEASIDRLLNRLKSDRAARARGQYTRTAALAGGAILLVILVFAALPLQFISRPDLQTVWFAAFCGVFGALLSVAVAVRERSLDTDGAKLDMALDATLRMFIGTLGGVLLLVIVQSGAFSLTLGNADFSVSENDQDLLLLGESWRRIALIGFIGGFFERMVPDLLKRAGVKDVEASEARSFAGAALGASGTEADPSRPAAATQATGDSPAKAEAEGHLAGEDETSDSCDDQERAVAADTHDAELPEALGGVEVSIPAPLSEEEKS